jgi:hypothetical protein
MSYIVCAAQVAFFLISLETATDAKEQSEASFLRTRTAPVLLPATMSAGELGRLAACVLLKVRRP